MHAQAPNCKAFLRMISKMGVLVGDFYLDLGQARLTVPLPNDVKQGKMKECYMNAGLLSTERPEFAYCEGYALRNDVFPMHHAWCLNEQGKVIDPTWPHDEKNEYLGVALNHMFVVMSSLKTGLWGILSERLPADVTEAHPKTYLHESWRPEAERMEAFWAKLKGDPQPKPKGRRPK